MNIWTRYGWLLLFLHGTLSFAQTIYEPCTGPGCEQAQCWSLAQCGTGIDMSEEPNGCIEKQGDYFVSTGVPCGTGGGGGGSGVSCPTPTATDQVLMSDGYTSAVWIELPDCPAGALSYDATANDFICLAVDSEPPTPPVLFVKKSGPESVTASTTLQDDNDLMLNLLCGGHTYVVHLELSLIAEGTGPDFKLALSHGSTGPQVFMNCLGITGSSTGNTTQTVNNDPGSQWLQVGTTNTVASCNGWVTTGTGCGGSSELLKLRWAQRQSNDDNVTVNANSYMTVEQIN